MKKCKYYKFYKALRPPTCGCDFCEEKWTNAQKQKKKKLKEVNSDCPDPESCEDGCQGFCSGEDDDIEDVVDYLKKHGG